jgi:hypothetical protein
MPGQSPNFKAAGNIYPARFVNIANDQSSLNPNSSTADFYVEESIGSTSGLLQTLVGISDIASREARADVATAGQLGLAAIEGDPIKVFGLGEVCLLEMAATCNAGQLLKQNGTTDGRGIPTVAPVGGTMQIYGAQALEACTNVGQFIRVRVLFGQM